MSVEVPESTPGASRHTFIADSAPEAVSAIRSQLGESARVLSVRQVPRTGLGRFFRSPRLEIVAEVPPAEPAAPAPPAPASPAPAAAAQAPEAVRRPVVAREDSLPAGPAKRFWDMLQRAGLRRGWLEQLDAGAEWHALALQPLSIALPRAAALLLRSVPVPVLPIGRRCAFFGSPGSGVTSALCKQIARDPAVSRQALAVVKLEHSRPNATEGLSVFCEALRVPLVRTPAELESLQDIEQIYFDAPGWRPNGGHDRSFRQWMDELEVESRVLVLNAAYDHTLLQEFYARGENAGATHVVFTHLDELPRWGKLWEFLLRGRLAPLFGTKGGSLASEIETDLLPLMVQHTIGDMNVP